MSRKSILKSISKSWIGESRHLPPQICKTESFNPFNKYTFSLKRKGWDKSPSLSIIFGLSSKTQWLSGLYYADFISFTALLNCAEVGRRNRILTNYRFLSHSQLIPNQNDRVVGTGHIQDFRMADSPSKINHGLMGS